MGDVRKPSGLNKFIEQFLVVTGSKTVRIILLLFIICGGFFTIYTEINRIFPVDISEIHGLTVQNEEKKPLIGPWTQKFLMKDDLEQVVQSINDLKLVQRQHLGDVISTLTLDETRYSIRIIYEAENSLRRHPVAWLYFLDDCRVIVDYGSYTQYRIAEPHYDDFLSILDEMAIKCEVND